MGHRAYGKRGAGRKTIERQRLLRLSGEPKGVKSPETPAQAFESDEAGSRKLAFFKTLLGLPTATQQDDLPCRTAAQSR